MSNSAVSTANRSPAATERMAQYRFQEEYWSISVIQDRRLREERHDYKTIPYFYTAPIYRYNRGAPITRSISTALTPCARP